MLMGSTEQRLACLKIAASMLKRITKEDDAPSAVELVEYAVVLEAYSRRGERPAGTVSHVDLPN